MRYVTVTLSREEEELHPVGHSIAAMMDHDIVSIHTLDQQSDGTYAELNRYRGERSTIKGILEREPSVNRFKLSGNSNGIASIQYAALPLGDILKDATLAGPVVLQWPLEFVADGDIHTIRATFVGPKPTLGRTIDGLSTHLDVGLRRTGAFADLRRQRIASLTDQQQELLEVAINDGYYEIPRETTQEAIANEFDVTPGTINDRLRRIERTLVKSLWYEESVESNNTFDDTSEFAD